MATFAVVTPAQAEESVCTFCSYSFGEHRFSGATCGEEEGGCFGCNDTPEDHIGCHAYRWEGECGDEHSKCGDANWNGNGEGGLLAFQDALVDAVARADDAAIVQLISEYGASSRVHLNSEREAVQVIGCAGTLAAHIPLPRRTFSAAYSREQVQVA